MAPMAAPAQVTGANQGIGLATSIELAKHGAKVYMVCRNPERGEAAVAQVKSQSGSSDVFLKVWGRCGRRCGVQPEAR
eukprot:357565-Chlamydomonas_euryale.AAC.3